MTRRKARLALLALATMVAAAGLAVLVGGLSWSGVVAVELVLLAGLVVLDRLVAPVVERWGRGAAGEEHVGQLLAELEDDGHLAIHDVGTGRGNIDVLPARMLAGYLSRSRQLLSREEARQLHNRLLHALEQADPSDRNSPATR
jgi:hypothetical protein